MKNFIKYILQKILGLNNYLYLFARFMILKLPRDKKEGDFMHFLQLISDGGDVLDIGANIGVMTYHFSKKLKNSVVHSFEPVPVNYNIIERIVKRFKLTNVKLYKYALGENNGEVNMIMPEKGQVLFHGLSHIQNQQGEQGRLFKVPMKKLDDLPELQNKPINAIKLDVEEYEYHVLKGAEEIIKQNLPLIYIELWESENKTKCFELLESAGYKSFINLRGKLKEYKKENGFQNFFFLQQEHLNFLNIKG